MERKDIERQSFKHNFLKEIILRMEKSTTVIFLHRITSEPGILSGRS